MNRIKLQGIYELKEAKFVKDLVVGDVISWNYGYQSEVIEIIKSNTGKTFTIILKSLNDGMIRSRKMKAVTLVAV